MVDPVRFRHVLGHYPTGVCAITATGTDGQPTGMIVGSFTSVSLNPPLVGFFPDKASGSWPRIEAAGQFCVNVLESGQADVCRGLATRGTDKFAGLSYGASPNGSPLFDHVVAWIDCALENVIEAGDHYFVLGRVLDLEASPKGHPMLFFQGRYGRFDHGPAAKPLDL